MTNESIYDVILALVVLSVVGFIIFIIIFIIVTIPLPKCHTYPDKNAISGYGFRCEYY